MKINRFRGWGMKWENVFVLFFLMFQSTNPIPITLSEEGVQTQIKKDGSLFISTNSSSAISILSSDNNYFLRVDLQDPRVSMRVGLANTDNGGLQPLSSMVTRYNSKGYIDWAMINGDLFSSGCGNGVNCAEGLTYIDGNHMTNWSSYGTTWQVRGNIGFDASKGVKISIGDAQTRRQMTIAGGPWIVTNGGAPTCSAQYISTLAKTYFSTGEQFDGDVRSWCTDTRAITMVGYGSDHRYLYMGVSLGGKTVIQLAQWLKERGAYEILRLDSGTSSGMYHNGSFIGGSNTRSIANHLALVVQDVPCKYSSDQIVLYEHADYGGSCVVKGIGNYQDAVAMEISGISSVKVGSNMQLTLCQANNYSGQCETFVGDDSNLSDNLIGNDLALSAKVEQLCTNGVTSSALKSGYAICAEEAGMCSFSGQATVAYGANSCFTYKDFINNVSCDNNNFIDPIIGTHKYCYLKLWRPGDANGDNLIDGRDYVIWVKYYSQNVTGGPSNGDFNYDGLVDGRDYVIWAGNYGT